MPSSLPRTNESQSQEIAQCLHIFKTPQVFLIKRKGLKPQITIILSGITLIVIIILACGCEFNFVRIVGSKGITL